MPPLVRLLREHAEEAAAELAAVALRNLALGNAANRAAISDAGGLGPLLRLLASGQERLAYPMHCQARPGPALSPFPLLCACCRYLVLTS